MRAEDRQRALADVKSRVVSEHLAASRPLDEILAESIYLERKRLKEEASGERTDIDRAFWDHVEKDLRRSSRRTQEDLLAEAVEHYAKEIVGHFDPRVYRAVTRVLPPALGVLLNAASPKRLLTHLPDLPKVDQALELIGEIAHLKKLCDAGVVILVPTHLSNLDSIIMGYALYRMGLPPFLYGAGLNLFANPMLGYFMHNLGAYTVDRKKTDPLYKDVLKAYATTTLELGYDNIFFPGGTRSRSGGVEKRLKLGLLGTGVDAYVANLQRKVPRPKVYVVPVSLSYQLVLEAETLVDDFLKDAGKSRYIISDDEFSRPKQVAEFVSHLLSLDDKIWFSVGRGYDPFGNPVDDDGESLDPMGRKIDTARYVLVDGVPESRADRDAEYTRELGERIADAFFAENVLMSTHILARAVFGLLRKSSPTKDVLRTIRTGSPHEELDLAAVHTTVEQLLGQLRRLEAERKVRLDPTVKTARADDVVADGLRHFAIYHATPAATRKGDRVMPTDRALLFYYQNRVEGYGVWPEPEVPPALSADHRGLGGAR
ncbi:MAG: 1-acyl-sn-glycerol-3-phosphate acyltransferase [Deltaproteobacteria bacterium]|nr:1-acyl-sn-glycerol-3-phosphate acyltransferase [Deltaproteobacteria bacterium]